MSKQDTIYAAQGSVQGEVYAKKWTNSPLFIFLSLIFIKYLYVFLAVNILEPYWYPGTGSYGIDFDPSKEIIASIVFIAITLTYVHRGEKSTFHDALLHVIMVFFYIPVNSSYSINNLPTEFFVLTNCYCILLILLLSNSRRTQNESNTLPDKSKEKPISLDANDLTDSMPIRIICFTVCTAFIIYKLSYNGLSFSLSIGSEYVYETRDTYVVYRNAIAGSFVSYLISAFTSLTEIITPVYFYLSLKRRRIIPVLISLLCVLSEYSMSSGKGSLFFLVIVIFVCILQKYDFIKSFKSFFSWGMIIILLLCWFAWHWINNDDFFMVIIRREMYFPAWINSMYYDFFSNNQKLMFGDSVFLLQKLLPNPYGRSTVLELISSIYFMDTMPHPNTGLFAEAYMHLGALGIVIFPLITCLIATFMNKAFVPYGDGFCVLLGVETAIAITNVPTLRTDFVLSHILLAFVFMFISKLYSDKTFIRKQAYQPGHSIF